MKRRPNIGKPQANSLKTEIKILYENLGIYIASLIKQIVGKIYTKTNIPQKIYSEVCFIANNWF